jgi:DnaJ-class molecular chaperone
MSEPDWDKLYSLDEALALDGEKLRQLTGEDHGPWGLIECPACQGAGEWDEGPLPASSGATEPTYRQVICGHCEGTGRVIDECETRSLEDLEAERSK